MGVGTYIIIAVALAVLAVSRITAALWGHKRDVHRAYIKLDAAMRRRTEAITEFLKAVKPALKESEPAYNAALEALKATLHARPAPEQAGLEAALTDCLRNLLDAVRAREELRAAPGVKKAFAPLIGNDLEIRGLAIDYNQIAAGFNRRSAAFPYNAACAVFAIHREPLFPYDAAPLKPEADQ